MGISPPSFVETVKKMSTDVDTRSFIIDLNVDIVSGMSTGIDSFFHTHD